MQIRAHLGFRSLSLCRRNSWRTRYGSLFALAIVLLLAWSLPSLGQSPVGRVTYLANEGVLLEVDGKKVLVDALFGDGIEGYPVVSPDVRADLESARGRFAGIDLVLASHEHRDHFDPNSVAKHLASNQEALFVGPPDAVRRLPEGANAESAYPSEGSDAEVNHRGISVRILRMHHGRARPSIQNLGLIVDVEGVRFLHVGDTELSLNEWRALGLNEMDIDVALLPAWQVSVEKLEAIGAQQVAAFHLAEATAPTSWFGPYRSRSERIAALKKFPDVVVFERAGQEVKVLHRHSPDN